ncbi:hypothetical protein V6N11_053485 [Hibiscus sabdariffa]|uniref:THH1/TOM1/TOM3 domain-containing protein n=1 Tax=Hibiscus sabdariffa TaxID=183260 RepID=A0ABR2UDM0_9ROSI
MFEEKEKSCSSSRELVGINVGFACFDGIIAVLAFSQLARIQFRNSQRGWTRQKTSWLSGDLHLDLMCLVRPLNSEPGQLGNMVCHCGISRMERDVIKLSHGPPQAEDRLEVEVENNVQLLCLFCLDSLCCLQRVAMLVILLWFYSHGVKISVSSPAISLVSVADFSRVDLCHQADDDEEEDDEQSFEEALLQNSLNRPKSSIADNCRICYPFRLIHVGSHQKIVILVTVLVFLLMMTFAVLIWIGMEDNPIDSSTVARVYIDLSAVALLLLGGALACYGLLLCRKMRNVRSERASSEIWKVAGLATVSVVCFTSSAFVALFTDIPMLYHWHELQIHGVYTSTLLILYYFIGSSVPSAFVLWIMRELPPVSKANIKEESTTVTFITDSSGAICRQQSWTAAASSQIQVSRGCAKEPLNQSADCAVRIALPRLTLGAR